MSSPIVHVGNRLYPINDNSARHLLAEINKGERIVVVKLDIPPHDKPQYAALNVAQIGSIEHFPSND